MNHISSWSLGFCTGFCVLLLSGTVAAQTAPSASSAPTPPSPPVYVAPSGHDQHFLLGNSTYRSPGLAVALSLTPLPVDFGNLYAENLGWGLAYTALEISLMAPMIRFAGSHMHHGVDDRGWSGTERNTMVALVAGYVGVKLVAGLHAGYAARGFNQRHGAAPMAAVLPVRGGAVLGFAQTF